MVLADSHKASPTPWYSGYQLLTSAYVYGIITLYDSSSQKIPLDLIKIIWSYNPNNTVILLVWASPRSLATTYGITIVFSSSAYLDVSVRQVSVYTYRLHR
jgi:hypothetical protein